MKIFLVLFLLGLVDMYPSYRKFGVGTSGLYAKKSVSGITSSLIYTPQTVKQEAYMDVLSNSSVSCVVGLGPAGCGKTLFACQSAIQGLKSDLCSKIVVTRPFVSVDQELMGFLPGSIEQKMSPWTRPIFDIFELYYTKREIGLMIESSVIEMAPLAYMRGRTFKNTWIIADEMQNSSPNQMFMLLSRLGEGSRIMITGDLSQSDLGSGNGLADFLGLVKKGSSSGLEQIHIVEMGSQDIQRSSFVKSIFELYSREPILVSKEVSNISLGKKINNDCALIPKELYKWNPKT